MKKMILLLPVLFSLNSYAGVDWMHKGNGGFVVLCDQKPPQTFDLYSVAYEHHWTLDRTYESDVQKRVEYLISRINKFNPRRASLYKAWAANFMKEAELIPNVNFGTLPDLGYSPHEDNCDLQQVIYQRQPDGLKKARYTVNSTVWKALSPFDQAGLIMHELIYRELALPPSDHDNSEFSRKFNAWLNSSEFENATVEDYLEMLQKLFVIQAQYKGYDILLAAQNTVKNSWTPFPLSFYKGALYGAVLDASMGPLQTAQVSLTPLCKTTDGLKSYGVAQFLTDGTLAVIRPTETNFTTHLVEMCLSTLKSKNPPFIITANTWFFDPQGHLGDAFGNFTGEAGLYEGPFSNSDFHFIVGPTSQIVNTAISMDSAGQFVSLEFWGEACRQTQTTQQRIIISNKSAYAQSEVWLLSDMQKKFDLLKPCD